MKKLLLITLVSASLQAETVTHTASRFEVSFAGSLQPVCGLEVNEVSTELTFDKDEEKPAELDIITNKAGQILRLSNFAYTYNFKDSSMEQYVEVKLYDSNGKNTLGSTAPWQKVGDFAKSHVIDQAETLYLAARLNQNENSVPSGNYEMTISFDATCEVL